MRRVQRLSSRVLYWQVETDGRSPTTAELCVQSHLHLWSSPSRVVRPLDSWNPCRLLILNNFKLAVHFLCSHIVVFGVLDLTVCHVSKGKRLICPLAASINNRQKHAWPAPICLWLANTHRLWLDVLSSLVIGVGVGVGVGGVCCTGLIKRPFCEHR